jgi:preprotein translocase subunit SecG
MKRKHDSGNLERTFWIVVILFVVVAVILILIEGHYWNFE